MGVITQSTMLLGVASVPPLKEKKFSCTLTLAEWSMHYIPSATGHLNSYYGGNLQTQPAINHRTTVAEHLRLQVVVLENALLALSTVCTKL